MNGISDTPKRKPFHWSVYNQSLVRRGDLTVYVGDDMGSKWTSGRDSGSVGRPEVYPDAVIALGLVLQQGYRLPLRQTTGLLRSLLRLAGVNLAVPDASTLCRRRSGVALPAWPKAGPCIVIDSTGLQIRGPNTWLTTVHGEQRRTYRKIHLGIDPETSAVVAGVVSTCQKHDSALLADVLDVANPKPRTTVIGDGAYDRRTCYAAARKRRVHLITPPGKRAIIHHDIGWFDRDKAIEECRFLGHAQWKRATGYHRRSLAESAMHRLKAAFGPGLRSRLWTNQVSEALLRAHIMNLWPTPKTFATA